MWRFFRKLKIELPYDPAISLLGRYLEKTLIQKDTCHNIVNQLYFNKTLKNEKNKKLMVAEEMKVTQIYKKRIVCSSSLKNIMGILIGIALYALEKYLS